MAIAKSINDDPPAKGKEKMKPVLFIVELTMNGLGSGVHYLPEDRVITSVFRLSGEQRNGLQYFKVRFYRLLGKLYVFKLGDKYIIKQRDLPAIEAEFREIYREFEKLREDIYKELCSKWPTIQRSLERFLVKQELDAKRVARLKPPESSKALLEMSYTFLSLPNLLQQYWDTAESFEQHEEYKGLAKRIREEGEKTLREIRVRYEEKLKQLETTTKELQEALKKKSKEAHRLSLKARALAEDTEDIAPLIPMKEQEETDLRNRLEEMAALMGSVGMERVKAVTKGLEEG